MLLFLIFLLAIVGIFLLMMFPTLWGRALYEEYEGSRVVICPENKRQVAVSIDAIHAAVTGLSKAPELRLSDCTRWPERRKCSQGCLPQALKTSPYRFGEVEIKTKKIYHLPILIAAFAGYILGALWHSHWLFRERWMNALGLSSQQLKDLVGWRSPHLLSTTVCLLFAYGVAWLLAVRQRSGLWQGMITSLFFWGALVLASSLSFSGLSRELLLIEGTYSFLLAVLVGAIVGGLHDKLRLSDVYERPLQTTHG
jgi:Protein of unknown function (DUF1761)